MMPGVLLKLSVAGAGVLGGLASGATVARTSRWVATLEPSTQAGLYVAAGFLGFYICSRLWPGPK